MTNLKDLDQNQRQQELLKHRCSCGALMILFDNNSECQGYKCPQCGSVEFSLSSKEK